MRWLILAIILTACGQKEQEEAAINMPTLDELVASFIEDANSRGWTLTKADIKEVNLVDYNINDSRSIQGTCITTQTGWAVYFRRDFSTDPRFKLVVYHELGHCVLKKGHSDNIEDIMYANVTDRPLSHWEESLDTLFSKTTELELSEEE